MESIKALQSKLAVIFFGLLFGQIAFAGVVLLILKGEPSNDPNTNIFLIVSSLLLFSGIVAGQVIAGARLKTLRDMRLEEVSAPYLSLSIIRFALIESSVLFATVVLLITGDNLFLIFIGVGIGYFIYLIPTKSRVAKELNCADAFPGDEF